MTATAQLSDPATLHRQAEVLRREADAVRRYAQRLAGQHAALRWDGPARAAFDTRLETRVPALQRLGTHLDKLAQDLDGIARSITAPTTPLHGTGLHEGSTGSGVKDLQQQLDDAGDSVGPDGVDGIFGPDTLAALKRFQASHHLPVTGIADAATMVALAAAPRAPKPTPKPAPAPVGGKGGAPAPVTTGGASFPVDKLPQRLKQWWPYVQESAAKYHLDPALVMAIIDQESSGNPTAVGGAGHGLMQVDGSPWPGSVNPHIAWLASHDGGNDPQSNIDYGCQILSGSVRPGGDLHAGVAAYNGSGPAASNYATTVLARYERIKAGTYS